MLAFVVAGGVFTVIHRITLEQRVRQIMEPYAHFIAVGTDAAVAFQDPVRSQEILDALRANSQILQADLFLDNGMRLASFSAAGGTAALPPPERGDGIEIGPDTAEMIQSLSNGGRLRLRISLQQLNEQTRLLLWLVGSGMLILLTATLGQLAVLRRTIARPIASLTADTERIRDQADYRYGVSASGTDEVVRLGQSLNAMMETIHQRELELRRLSAFQRAILQHAAHAIVSTTPEGVVTSFNPAAERLLGYAASELVGRETPALWHDQEEMAQYASQLSRKLGTPIAPGFGVFTAQPQRDRPEEREWTFIRKDGLRIPVNLSVTALRGEAGEITGFVGLAYDLTERKQTQHQLQLLSFALDTVKETIVLMGENDPRFLYANRSTAVTLGYSVEELTGGMGVFDIDPDWSEATWKAFWPQLLARRQVRFESVHRTRDGRIFPVEVTGNYFEFDGNTYNLAICRDISERRRIESALRESERRYRLVFENSPVPIWEEDFSAVRAFFGGLNKVGVDDLDAYFERHPERLEECAAQVKITDVNHPALVLLEAAGKNELLTGLVNTFTEESFAVFRQELISLWNGETRFRKDAVVKTLTGKLRYVTVHLSVCPGYEESLAKVLVSLVDITERKLAEQALADREREFRTLTENHPDGIVRFDTQGRHLYINGAAQQLSGTSRMPLLGKTLSELPLPGNPELTRPLQDTIAKVVAEGRPAVTEFVWPNGRVSEIRYIPEVDRGGVVISVLAIARDITERKRAEEQVRQYQDTLEETVQQRTKELLSARDAAEAANKAKSVFLANMSHELRTPLNSILGFSGMMRRDPEITDKQRENLDIINRSGEHLLNLINDVLEMAKIESGRVQLDVAAFDLQGMVDEVAQMMAVKAQEKGLDLVVDRSVEFPRYIKSDGARIRQILINLIGNAVKFTLHGGVAVRLKVEQNGGHFLMIEVQDTGRGIGAEEQSRLFEPFVQLNDSGSQGGTGLGLAITRQFIRFLGGRIFVDSVPGKGSIFRVELPVEPALASEVVNVPGRPFSRVAGLAPGQPQFRILIAEDQYENQLLLNRLMTGLGLQTRIAENGEQCLQVFQEWRPDLIWMDRRMPVMDGLQATKRLRGLPGGHAVKIVAVTASVFKEEQQEMLEAGMDDFVRKPYRFEEIYECLSRQLGIEYVYLGERLADSAIPVALSPALLSELPPDLREPLKQALKKLDSERIQAIIGSIAQNNAELAAALTHYADAFDYPAILKWLDGASGFGGR